MLWKFASKTNHYTIMGLIKLIGALHKDADKTTWFAI